MGSKHFSVGSCIYLDSLEFQFGLDKQVLYFLLGLGMFWVDFVLQGSLCRGFGRGCDKVRPESDLWELSTSTQEKAENAHGQTLSHFRVSSCLEEKVSVTLGTDTRAHALNQTFFKVVSFLLSYRFLRN